MHDKKLICFFLIALILAVCIGTASASENVTSISADEEKTFTNIQTAINNANENDTIELEGNYKSHGKEIQINKSITITSKDGAVLDGNGKSTIFNITNVNVCLMNLNIKNSYSNTITPAIYATGNLTVINSSFTNNTVFINYNLAHSSEQYLSEPYAGAIYSTNNLNIVNSTFIGNYGLCEEIIENIDDISHSYSYSFYNYTRGGAVNSKGKLTIKKSKFEDLINSQSTLHIEDSTFKATKIVSKREATIINSTFSDGNDLIHIEGNLTLIDSNITNCSRWAIYVKYDFNSNYNRILIDGCNFKNAPEITAQFIEIWDSDEMLITNSNFSNIGELEFYDTKLNVINTTFENNKNGLYCDNGKFLNCIFSNNFEFIRGNKISIENSTFKNNTGYFGSAINGKNIIIKNSEFADNQEGVIISHENINIDGKKISEMNVFDNDLKKIRLIRASLSKLTTTYLSGKSINIKLTFKDGKPVPDYDFVLILTKGKKTKYYYPSTNSKGIYNFKASTLDVGTYKLKTSEDKTTTTLKITKAKTTVKAPKVTNKYKKSKNFKVTVKNKATKKAVKNTYVKIKIDKKTYKIKTNSKGIAKFNTKKLKIGKHKVVISSGNSNYIMSAKSTITIK
ncbi:right-handed parallel beta-helix repeat-containing protein [uncultured Methanobrevibacter sp.]|uniref:right-handed parallel beta-helix repeat-containing protein n=2 Tax=Methanobrevibacter TaxID=2172 RepID=UPI003208B484